MKKLAFSALLAATLLSAAEYKHEVSGMVGRNFFPDGQRLNDYNMGALEYQYNNGATVLKPEVSLFYGKANYDESPAHDSKAYGAALNGVYTMPTFFGKLTPFAKVGVGYQTMDDTATVNENKNGLFGDVGLGAKIALTQQLALKLEVVDMYKHNSDWDNNVVALAGLSYAFGAKSAPVVEQPKAVVVAPVDSDGDGVVDGSDKCSNSPKGFKVDANGCTVDSDKDGVADNLDTCSNTPAGSKVDAKGCVIPVAVAVVDADKDGVADSLDKCANSPAGFKVDANGCTVDSDKDGVLDNLDKCANSPAGFKVDANGCTVDGDNDGIADNLDKCQNTPAGFKVDAEGCALKATLNVKFPSGSDRIVSPADKAQILAFATFLKENTVYKAAITGYTDNVGNATANQKLSLRRANAVKAALVKAGVAADRLTTEGKGGLDPIATNATKEGQALNRRIEVGLSH